MSPSASPGRQPRDLSIDHLRSLVVLALILFHTARLFDGEAWHIKHVDTFAAADMVVAVFNIVGMPLLFLLAGMSAYASLGSRGPGRFVGERLGRLFVPLLFGMLIVVPPQVYVERISSSVALRSSPIDFTGSYLEFYPAFFASCCYPEGNFSWHHLWFLAYLLVLSVALLPVLLLLRRVLRDERTKLSRNAAGLALVALGVPLVAIELMLRPAFPSTHALIDDWANTLHFLWLMLAGAVLMAGLGLVEATEIHRRIWLLAAAALATGWLAMLFGVIPPVPEVGLVLRTAAEWTVLVALVGYARVHFARPLLFLTAFGAIAMPFYIVHQTVIVLMGYWLLGWVDLPLVKYGFIAAASFGASLAFAALAARHVALRSIFGIKVRGAGTAASPAQDGRASPVEPCASDAENRQAPA